MQPKKYTKNDAELIDLGAKTIFKYPSPTKDFDVGRMVVNGRHPEGDNTFIVESACSFVMYVLSGNGTVYAGESVFDVKPEDVVVVPKNNNFAVEGKFEYITFDTPAWFAEQSKEVKA